MMIKNYRPATIKSIVCLFFLLFIQLTTINAQTISFSSSGLVGENVNNPTSLEFGPDGRLYVAQQDGTIWAFTVTRDNAAPGSGTYTVTNTETINIVKNSVPNHNDDGIFNNTLIRQVTGIATAGTASNPALYVTSSDWRIGGGGSLGNDTNLDTNSGILSKLTWNGSSWDKVDLIRGLPRCEENHAINGIDLFEQGGTSYMLLQMGGNTNKGAPSNNFAGIPEFYLSGALLIINLTQLEGMPVYTDPRTNTQYAYDLPTLNDPTRADINNTSPNFPYPVGHPMYNTTIDIGDPFGGNNGLNQAFPETGGPVQVFSPGYRNAYDVLVAQNGKIYVPDNGPNTSWGGTPLIYTSGGVLKNPQVFDEFAGDYVTNDFNEDNSQGFGDPLHYIGTINDANGTYYAGHPVPIRAFPSRADVVEYRYGDDPNDGTSNIDWYEASRHNWADLLVGVQGYFQNSFSIANFPDDPRQGAYLSKNVGDPGLNVLDVVSSSTNGICEYTATNFSGAMQGDLLTASFNGNINRYVLNASGDAVVLEEQTFSGFGSIPLDVVAQGDTDPFPGTVWAATYGADNITVFEPADFGNCPQPGDLDYDPNADSDNDGYTNQDEVDNGTNHCSGGSVPNDNDGDNISDLNDPDDDNDGILDVDDAFAIDPDNGTTTNLPINYSFFNNDPGTGFFGLGLTGLMVDPSGSTDYLTQYDESNMSFGGAGGKATVDLVPEGDALEGTNTQQYGFQLGINADVNSNPFTAHSKIESPFFAVGGAQTAPQNFQSQGIYIGNGDQDNYLKVVLMDGITDGDAIYGLQVLLEDAGTITSDTSFDIPNVLDAESVDLYISVDPTSNTALPYYSLDNGGSVIALGSPITLPASFLSAADNKGLAVGLIATSAGPGDAFSATWDFMKITENLPLTLSVNNNTSAIDFGEAPINSSDIQLIINAANLGGPESGVLQISQINITGTDAALFSSQNGALPINIGPGADVSFPVTFMPNGVTGSKSATLEFIHDGVNSPYNVPLTAILTEQQVPLVRINAGDVTFTATDGGPDWEQNSTKGATSGPSYTVNVGEISTHGLSAANKHTSIPSYIDNTTYEALFNKERWDLAGGAEMQFDIPLDNGNYTVNLYMANGFSGTGAPGQRVFDVLIEGAIVLDDLDLAVEFGNQVGGMFSFPITLTDGVLNIGFAHDVIENPLINAIEILGALPQITIDPITDQSNFVGDVVSLAVAASGGDSGQNYTYSISGQPDGIAIEPTNGHIFGTITETALTGGPSADGIHNVTVTVTQSGIPDATEQFTWTINALPDLWIDKNEDENYIARHECSFVQAGDKFYMLGGRESAQTIDVYDYTNNTWTQKVGSAPIEFNHFQAIEYQGLIWVIGAFKDNNFPNELPADHVWVYDPANDIWIQGPEIPAGRKRGSAALAIHNDKFYVLAGNTLGHNGGYVSWFDEYDPATGTWTALTDAPRARDHFHTAIIDGKLYAVSGRLSGDAGGTFGPVIPEVDVYDFNTSGWSTLPVGQNLPTPRAGAGVAALQGKLYVAGGEIPSSADALTVTEVYDPQTQTWSTAASLNHKRHGTQAIVSGNGIFVAGGSPIQGGGNQKNMEVYGSDNPTGTPITASNVTAPTGVTFSEGETKDIILEVSGGNTAIIISSIVISGTNAGLFNITAGDLSDFLVKPNSSHTISVEFTGTGTDKNAVLTITYNNGLAKIVNLTSGLLNEVIFRVNAGGALTTSNDAFMDWTEDRSAGSAGGAATTGTPSSYVNAGTQDVTFGVTLSGFTNTTGYPDSLFAVERYNTFDSPNNMQWDFPVTNGVYTVNLLFGEVWNGIQNPNIREFDVFIEDKLVLENYDQNEVYGWNVAIVETFNTEVTDGNLDIDFVKILENPNIKGIEIIRLSDLPTNNPPLVTNPGAQTNTEEDVVSLQINADDGNGDTQILTYAATNLPLGLSIDPDTGLVSGTISTASISSNTFQEDSGLVVIEAESGTLSATWSQLTDNNITGILAGADHFLDQNGGVVNYDIQITTPGVYRINWRSDFGGSDPTQQNDTWMKLPNNDDVWFFGQKGTTGTEATMINNLQGAQANVVFPIGSTRVTGATTPAGAGDNGWFKVYRSNSESWKWQASTSDNDPHNIYAYFVNPGTYTLQISERSLGHAIDKIVLYKVDGTNYTNLQLTNAVESPTVQIIEGAASNSPYNVEVTVTDNGVTPEATAIQFTWNINPNNTTHALIIETSLQGRTSNAGDYTVQLYEVVNLTTPKYDFNITANNAGQLAIPSLIDSGDYKLVIGHGNYLTQIIDITVNSNTSIPVGEFKGGDVNGDNVINALDFSLLVASFNKSSGEAGYNANADINGDGVVSALDFSILASNYNTQGDNL
ncbi:malectin domain-containing carbohydrate-binding protein [Leptobacterium sp. I13]|uniref:malectin domain-containing carbohydrate-binding protein n=1 Tax=Leptobacterium meishanense TaxID=3128904 RepID=UPI0030ED81D7